MAELSAGPPLTPNLHDSSPLNTLIRRTSSRRVNKQKPIIANLEPPGTPPRQTASSSSHTVPSAPPSPILHTQFRNSTATAASYYDDGASMRTVSWDARSATAPFHNRAPHESMASNYDLDAITNRYRDTWRSSGVVDPPSVYDPPDVPDLPTVVVSAAPESQPTPEAWQQEYEYEYPGPAKGGRMPSRVQAPNLNFSRPVVQPMSDLDWHESEDRKREVLMRNSPHPTSPIHSPAHSPATSPRFGSTPLAGSRPVSPASLREQQPYNPYPSPTPSPNVAQSPASSSLQAHSPVSPGGQSPRVTSSTSVYSDYSFYELPPTPTSATTNGPPSPALFPASPSGAPNAPRTPTTPASPGNPGRTRAKSSASKHKAETPAEANPQTPQDFLQLGIKCHLENRLAESAQAFEKSATLGGGCGVGMLMWGLAQRHGWGCAKDEATGFKWLRRAAELAVSDMEKGQQGDMSAVRVSVIWSFVPDVVVADSGHLDGVGACYLRSGTELLPRLGRSEGQGDGSGMRYAGYSRCACVLTSL